MILGPLGNFEDLFVIMRFLVITMIWWYEELMWLERSVVIVVTSVSVRVVVWRPLVIVSNFADYGTVLWLLRPYGVTLHFSADFGDLWWSGNLWWMWSYYDQFWPRYPWTENKLIVFNHPKEFSFLCMSLTSDIAVYHYSFEIVLSLKTLFCQDAWNESKWSVYMPLTGGMKNI